MERAGRQLSSEEKEEFIRRHFVERVPISQLCDELGIALDHFDTWWECQLKDEPKITAARARRTGKEWKDFLDKWPRASADSIAPTYALPPELVSAISSSAKDWLTVEELGFERDLAELCSDSSAIGFLSGKPVAYDLLCKARPTPPLSQKLLEDFGWAEHWNLDSAKRMLETGDERIKLLRAQQEAYAGWLTTNPQFLTECKKLKASEAAELKAGLKLDPRGDLAGDFMKFCERWKLAGMATWDLPLPLGADLTGLGILPVGRGEDEATRLVFSPTMRLPARYPIRELMNDIRTTDAGDHLKEWNDVLNQEEDQAIGMGRYRQSLKLHFYRNIVLKSRYADRFRGNVERLDLVFAKFFDDIAEDSVKKMRLAIERRLRAG